MTLMVIGGSSRLGSSSSNVYDYLTLNSSASAPTYTQGNLYWDSTDKCLAFQTEVNGVTIQVGQEAVTRVVNKTGSLIANGSVVYINGAQGQRPTVALVRADSTNAHKTIGICTYDIANNAEGYITRNGLVRDLDTSAFSDGDELFLSSTTSGAITNTRPSAPNHAVKIGVCAYSHSSNGKILVDVDRGGELSTQDDVKISSITTGDGLRWNGTGLYWENTAAAAWHDKAGTWSALQTFSAGLTVSSGSVTLPALSIGIAAINATGTASASTILRGDGTWATIGNGTVTSVAATGSDGISVSGSPITGSGTIAFSLSDGGIANAKLANIAANTIKGNNTGVTAVVKDLTTTEVATMLPLTTTSAKGMCPQLPSAGGTGVFLRGDGTWQAVGGSGTVTSVDVSGGSTGLTFSGGPVTASGTLTMAGTLGIANGGTGSGTASAARTALGAAGLADANTFTTAQTISAALTSRQITINTGTTANVYMAWTNNGVGRWTVALGATETGSNVGSDLYFNNYNDAGGQISTPLILKRSTNDAIFAGNIGIGVTPSGTYKLEVAGATLCTGWSYTGNGSGATSQIVNGNNSGAGGGSRLRFQAGGTDVAQIGMLSAITGGAYDATTYISSGTGLALKLGAAYGYAIHIDTSQNVGIGIAPSARVHAYGSGYNGGRGKFESSNHANSITIAGVDGAGINDIAFLDLDGGVNSKRWILGVTGTGTGSTGRLRFMADVSGSYYERGSWLNSGELGIGVTPTTGNGLLQLASGTTKANGIAFGDTYVFRAAAGHMYTQGPSATDIGWTVSRSSGEDVLMLAGSGVGIIGTSSNHPLWIRSNSTTAITIDTSQNATFAGSVTAGSKAADPTGANGMIYYDSANNRLRAYVNGAWKTITVA